MTMRKNIFLIAFLALAITVNAKSVPESSVPQAVQTYVKTTYPAANRIEWDSKKDESYTALFFIDGREISVEVNRDGKLLSSREVIFTRALPAAVVSYINTNYADAEIANSSKITSGDNVTYSVEVIAAGKGGYGKPQKLIFDWEGKLLKK